MKQSKGFVALISVILISAILLIVATTLSFGSFFERFNILESEYKIRSGALADACVDTALLQLVQGFSITTPFVVTVSGSDNCTIKTISTIGTQKVIDIQAVYRNSYTNIEVKVSASDQSIISWVELNSL